MKKNFIYFFLIIALSLLFIVQSLDLYQVRCNRDEIMYMLRESLDREYEWEIILKECHQDNGHDTLFFENCIFWWPETGYRTPQPINKVSVTEVKFTISNPELYIYCDSVDGETWKCQCYATESAVYPLFAHTVHFGMPNEDAIMFLVMKSKEAIEYGGK